MVWECDLKRGSLHRQEGDGNGSVTKGKRNAQEKIVGQCEG